MAQVSNPKIQWAIHIVLLIALLALSPARAQSQDGRPVADAGSSRYAAKDPVQLDGTGSYDLGDSGPLSYTWRQIAGPSVEATDTDTATPTISGFSQTDEIQECEFELIVSNAEYDSLPDTVRVVVVPDFGESNLSLVNKPFDPNKPTVIYFGGGDCEIGYTGSINQDIFNPDLYSHANVIHFPQGYTRDSDRSAHTYYKYGDMIIVYLSSVALDYKQLIQSGGYSTGGQPAIDVGIRLNQTYRDARYAVNQVTLFDATRFCRNYSASISTFLGSSVDGEQCWLDNYVGTNQGFHPDVLNVVLSLSHQVITAWYSNSFTGGDMKKFNGGVVAGAYWSVIGPGKNLQLASTLNEQTYNFQWYGDILSGYMDFYDEPNHPGRLPEPVTLIGPEDGAIVDANGAVFSCDESENAIGYQLLFGSDPHRVMDYYVVSDTPDPPTQVVTASFFEQTWWTIKARDQYGSTIYADPISVHFENIDQQPIENITIGKKYYTFRHAINDADNGHEIVVSPGVYQEKINFKGKNLTLRSTDPNDLAVVSKTVITADGEYVVIFSGGEDSNCVLDGFTIADSHNGINCTAASPTIVNCNIVDNVGDGMKLYMGSNPTISKCIIAGNDGSGIAMLNFQSGRTTLFNYPTIVNCTIVNNSEVGISEAMPKVLNSIIYNNSVQIPGSYAVVQYSNVQGSFPGEGNIDDDPSFADLENGDYHLKSQAGRWNSIGQIWVQDDVTSPCIDAGDPTSPIGLEPAPNGDRINMGAYGGTLEASKSP